MNTNQLTEGIIADERFTPATIRQIRMAAIPPSCLAKKALEGYTAILEPNRVPGISNKTVLQCVKRGQQGPAYVSRSGRKVLRDNILAIKQPSFCLTSSLGV